MQTIKYALDRTHFQGPGWVVPFDLCTWTYEIENEIGQKLKLDEKGETLNNLNNHMGQIYCMVVTCLDVCIIYSGADPGFVVRGDVSRRGVWGPLNVPSGSKVEPW